MAKVGLPKELKVSEKCGIFKLIWSGKPEKKLANP